MAVVTDSDECALCRMYMPSQKRRSFFFQRERQRSRLDYFRAPILLRASIVSHVFYSYIRVNLRCETWASTSGRRKALWAR